MSRGSEPIRYSRNFLRSYRAIPAGPTPPAPTPLNPSPRPWFGPDFDLMSTWFGPGRSGWNGSVAPQKVSRQYSTGHWRCPPREPSSRPQLKYSTQISAPMRAHLFIQCRGLASGTIIDQNASPPSPIVGSKKVSENWARLRLRGQKKHIHFFNINFLAPTQITRLWAARKKRCCASFPGKECIERGKTVKN